MPILLGLISWILAGLVTGLAAWAFLPGPARPGALAAPLVGVGGALAGGLLATLLGFGGLASYDLRALTVAALVSLVGLVLWRLARLRRTARLAATPDA